MARYEGGTKVRGGYYWNPSAWSVVAVEGESGTLPGRHGDGYVRLHWVAALLLAPILGGLFVVFLPFIAFGMLIDAGWRAVFGGARRGARDLAATMTPGWRPGEAHLTGRASEEKPGDVAAGGAGEEALREVAEEVARKRRAERNGNDEP
jgi:hypothetical protein